MRERGAHSHGRYLPWLAVALPACSLLVALVPDGFPLITIRAFLLPGAALLLMAGVLAAMRSHTWVVDGAVLAALICSAPVFLVTLKLGHPVNAPPGLRVTQMNVHQVNTSFAGVVATARANSADLLSVQEVDARWNAALVEGLSDLYPYQLVRTGDDNYGLALFSRSPLEDAAVFDLSGLPALRATVRVNEKRVLVLAVHLRSPESPSDLKQRNSQWAALADLVNNASGPVAVVGDLNTVPWDDAARHFNANTSMTWGPCPLAATWPSIGGVALIPLDHLLVSPNLGILKPNTFLIPGSDHRGISASIAMVP